MTEENAAGPRNGAPFIARIVGKGKVTVPKNVRDLLGLQEGDLAEFTAVRKIGGDVGRTGIAEPAPGPPRPPDRPGSEGGP